MNTFIKHWNSKHKTALMTIFDTDIKRARAALRAKGKNSFSFHGRCPAQYKSVKAQQREKPNFYNKVSDNPDPSFWNST